jgi:pyridoxine/pyridoxamine 5'-phosphate oxidase
LIEFLIAKNRRRLYLLSNRASVSTDSPQVDARSFATLSASPNSSKSLSSCNVDSRTKLAKQLRQTQPSFQIANQVQKKPHFCGFELAGTLIVQVSLWISGISPASPPPR